MANDIDKTSPHYKGDFGSIYEVNKKFPTGGVAGDFVVIEGWAHYWNADRATWCVNAERDSYWDELITNIIEKFKLVRGATYMGVASLDTVPAKVIGAKMYYFATVAGTYKNFGDLVVPQGINVLYSENGSSWVNTTLLEVAQELGVSTKKVVSQKALNEALNLKANQSSVNEALAKKADNEEMNRLLGTKANTADVNTELAKKFDKESVVQESGEAEDKVMSQKATTNIYGFVHNHPFYSFALVDSFLRAVFTIDKYGNIDWNKGVPKPIKEALSVKKDVEADRDFVDLFVSKALSGVKSTSWVDATVDSKGKVIDGIKPDGTHYFHKIESPSLNEAILAKKNVEVSQAIKLVDLNVKKIVRPAFTGNYILKEITNSADLFAEIDNYNSGTDNVILSITNDITIENDGSINITNGSSNHLIIQGNGNLLRKNNKQVVENITYTNGLARTSIANLTYVYGQRFATDKGNILECSKSEVYQADGQIEDENGNNLTSENNSLKGIRRFKLPTELSTLSITENDNVYIDISHWFTGSICKVLKVENGYLYFNYSGAYSINGDYEFLKEKASFFFYNLSYDGKGFLYKDGYLYFSPEYKHLFQETEFTIKITNNSGFVKIENLSFIDTVIKNYRSKCLIEKCTFKNNDNLVVSNLTYDSSDDLSTVAQDKGELYVNECHFEKLSKGAIFSSVDTSCEICDNTFVDTGLSRNNYNCIEVLGYHHVYNNRFTDYGYCGIRVGYIKKVYPKDFVCEGIVEHNILKQSEEYFSSKARFFVLMDTGAITTDDTIKNAIIRYNKIINFVGRGANRGIFCDYGTSNVTIYGNIIENTPNSYAIDAYNSSNEYQDDEKKSSINKVIFHNITDNGILLEGSHLVEDNGCILGHNIKTKNFNLDDKVSNVVLEEEQYIDYVMQIANGVVKSNSNYNIYLN